MATRLGWHGWGRVRGAVALRAYVEEDQEEEGQDAPFQGESWQAPEHGPLIEPIMTKPLLTSGRATATTIESPAEALVAPLDRAGWHGRPVVFGVQTCSV